MSTNQQQVQVEELWRWALPDYREERLQERLTDRWPGDDNVDGRIAYGYPPTFQPGYVGPRYLAWSPKTLAKLLAADANVLVSSLRLHRQVLQHEFPHPAHDAVLTQ